MFTGFLTHVDGWMNESREPVNIHDPSSSPFSWNKCRIVMIQKLQGHAVGIDLLDIIIDFGAWVKVLTWTGR